MSGSNRFSYSYAHINFIEFNPVLKWYDLLFQKAPIAPISDEFVFVMIQKMSLVRKTNIQYALIVDFSKLFFSILLLRHPFTYLFVIFIQKDKKYYVRFK